MSSQLRIGHGYDVHRLVEGRRCIIGGVDIPHDKGLLGHSDADVLAHALADAILGAARAGDIGKLFPDTDPAYKGADSKVLLAQTINILKADGWQVGNIDATICAERPKINPHVQAMKECLSPIMHISTNDISIKATTTEKLGFTGREEGISAYAVVLIEKV